MKYIPIIILIIILIAPTVTLLNLHKETGLKQTNEYKKVFFHSKKDFLFSFTSPKEKLNSIALKIWNLSIEKSKPIYFNLLLDKKIIRQLKLSDVNLSNGDIVRFAFPEITDSKNKRFTLVLSAPNTEKDDVIGVYTNAYNDPFIITYHTPSSKLRLISGVYESFTNKIFADPIFVVAWFILFGSATFLIKTLDI